jgi:hypothetical protein
MSNESTVFPIFEHCVTAIRNARLIRRTNRQDKEFHFQNWVKSCLDDASLQYESGGRNSYPDFRIVRIPEGYEVKGLAYPGREVDYDANSQPPTGRHNGRTLFYIFGRYPAVPDGDSYPVLDLVICHGDFLNADHDYVHENKSIKGFGSYGDLMIRDRKMYVAPTPFGLLAGVAHTQTLILPEQIAVPSHFKSVGSLVRREAERVIVSYMFDLRNNLLTAETVINPHAGQTHVFRAWRLQDGIGEPVTLRPAKVVQDRSSDDYV